MSDHDHPHRQDAPPTRPIRQLRLRLRLALVVLALTAGVCVMFSAFAAPSVHSGADDLPIGVSGGAAAVESFSTTLESVAPGDFDVTGYADAASLRAAIEDRDVVGGFDLGAPSAAAQAPSVTVYLASGAGANYAQTLRGVGSALAADGGQIAYRDLAPFTADDPAGGGVNTLAIPLIFGGMFSGVVIGLVLKATGLRRAVLAVVVSVGVGLAVAALLRFGFHTIDQGYWLTALAIGMGAGAIALTVLGLEATIGTPGLGIGALLMMFVANPLGGFTTGWEWLPKPWGFIGQLLPVGATGTAVRSAGFFDGNGVAQPLIVLAAWIAVGLALTITGGRRVAAAPGADAPVVTEPESEVLVLGEHRSRSDVRG